MSILNSTSPAKKYDHLGVYYRKSFLTPEEVAVLSNYSSLYKSESDKYEVGFISSKFIQNAAESYQYKNQVKEIFTKIKNEMKSVYNIDSLYLNIVQDIKISSSVSKSYSVSSFDPVSDINTPVGDTTPDTVKNFLDLTMTDIQEGYWQ